MSLLLFLFYWVIIPVSLFLITRWLFRRTTAPFRKRMVVVVSVTAFIGLLWLAAGEKWWLDYQVRELCAKDGGVKVYEAVTLPAERFDKRWQFINFYKPTQGENSLGVEYLFKQDTHYYRIGNPEMSRVQYQIYRRSDGKLLGETILYGRGGGDLPGPWHGSSFTCPTYAEAGINVLLQKLFIQFNSKE